MTKAQIEAQLLVMEQKLLDTKDALSRGPVNDMLKLVVPMFEDQILIMRNILALID